MTSGTNTQPMTVQKMTNSMPITPPGRIGRPLNHTRGAEEVSRRKQARDFGQTKKMTSDGLKLNHARHCGAPRSAAIFPGRHPLAILAPA
jgi:hypothetical protein